MPNDLDTEHRHQLRTSIAAATVAALGLLAACSEPGDHEPQTEPPTTHMAEVDDALDPAEPLPEADSTPFVLAENLPPRIEWIESDNPALSALGRLEREHGEAAFDGMMEFLFIPNTFEEHQAVSEWMAPALHQLDAAGVTNFDLILEPGSASMGEDFDADNFREFLEELRDQGITADMLGNVTVYPEPIVGEWQNNDPAHYVSTVNLQLRILREVFGESVKTKLLVDVADVESLAIIEALQNSDTQLEPFDSLGIQVFGNGAPIPRRDFTPGEPGYNPTSPNAPDIRSYFNVSRVSQLAQAFGVTSVSLNTGFIATDTNPYSQGVYSGADQLSMAQQFMGCIRDLNTQFGIRTTNVVLFMANKLSSEGRDFRIQPTPGVDSLLELARDLHREQIPLLGYAGEEEG